MRSIPQQMAALKAGRWQIGVGHTLRDKTFIVIAPRVKPTLPVAIDTAKLERFASGTWSLFTGAAELDRLDDIGRARAARDQRGVAIERTVPDPARGVVAVLARYQQLAAHGGTQIVDSR